MGGRDLPIKCPHGRTVDWGDFGEPEDAEDCQLCSEHRRSTRHARVFEVLHEALTLKGVALSGSDLNTLTDLVLTATNEERPNA